MSDYISAILSRRSIYGINSESTLPDHELETMLGHIMKNMPTAYNMQSTRMVLLLQDAHKKLWDIVLETLRPGVPADKFPRTEKKIAGFAAGHGTILYFDDDDVTKQYMQDNPLYADNFPPWALQQNGMLQFAVWAALEDAGFGANLQHYNPLIDDEVKRTFDLPTQWKLLAQMPFGKPTAPAGEKDIDPLDARFKIIR